MSIGSNLIDVLEKDGIVLKDKKEVEKNIENNFRQGRLRFIPDKNGVPIGFFTWEERIKNGEKCIFINNMFIKKDCKKEFNLLRLRSFFREKYPDAYLFYWKSRKRGRYVSVH